MFGIYLVMVFFALITGVMLWADGELPDIMRPGAMTLP
jgi:hypothetical protein